MKLIKIVSVCISILFLASCESNTTQELSPVVVVVAKPTYAKNVQPIISASCIECHSGGEQLPNLDSYEQLVEATKNGKLICKINGTCGSIMPKSGKLPQSTIDIIELWKTNNYEK